MIKRLILNLSTVFILIFLNACTVMTSIEEGFESLTQSFSEVDEVVAPTEETENNSVMQSTRQILDTHSEFNQQKKTSLAISTIRVFDNVWQRIPSLYQLSDINNQQIETQLKWYKKHPDYFKRISKRAQPFLHLITEEVEQRQMPGEIALLPIIESAFKSDVYSKQMAAGLWQFVPATGRYFGLKQTWWHDGRLDAYLATDAALTYLTQLNKYYKGDWLLALAAYNAGAGNVDKAIKKNKARGEAIDYWSLDLPKETRRYIPKLLAIAKLVQHAEKYNLHLYPIENKAYLQLVNIKSQIDFSVLAKVSGLSIAELKTYNPAFKRWSTAPDGPHHLLLPVNTIKNFEIQLAKIPNTERLKTFRHKIRSGESLSTIAHNYSISIKSLKQTNHLKHNHIRAGKYLLIPGEHQVKVKVDPKALPYVVSMNTSNNMPNYYTIRQGDSLWTISRHYNLSHKKLAAINGLNSTDTLSIGQRITIYKPDKQIKKIQLLNYQVKQGDSLYRIAKLFNVSVKNLKKWNKLNKSNLLKPGQKLKVYQQAI